MMHPEFIAGITLLDEQRIEFRSVTERSHISPVFARSVDGLLSSRGVKLCGLYLQNELASFACVMHRHWLSDKKKVRGLSIGLVTTKEKFRNKGLASKLLQEIELYARGQLVDFLYLQGIPNFYHELGFRGFSPKRKYILHSKAPQEFKGTIRPLTEADLPIVRTMFEEYNTANRGRVQRTDSDWEELIGCLSTTFLFFNPKLVFDQYEQPVGYYCTSPESPTIVREFVTGTSADAAEIVLSALASDIQIDPSKNIEIFASEFGPIRSLTKDRINADFVCFLRPKSSNMIKWLNYNLDTMEIENSFVFQGDNL